ncbi:hypothetical protein ACFP1I_11785 [Dyadobacter subterraneus]|uniref:Uncharacterized protein n=1 Tax=Dyadobacter subterraneus TaxID=2773304 RepID=A0ABR9WDP9_9BACT|nr:hypothetical protein [Dyadobacter subterraneus]
MAELDVQPKRKSPWWIWILLALVISILIYFFRSCDNTESAATDSKDSVSQMIPASHPDWESVDFNSPSASFNDNRYKYLCPGK